MKAGPLRHRIVCDEPITSTAENGEELVSFIPAFTVWAAIEPVNGRERLYGEQIIAEGSTRIRIRWSTQAQRIDAKWRLRHRDTIYNISGPPAEVDMGHREIEIVVTSGVNLG
jgi:SPP1 family predicted phage head-tail adaptor